MSFSDLHAIDLIISISIILTALLAYVAKKIDLWGALLGALMAFVIWQGAELPGLLSLFLFFVFGSIVSSWKKDFKSRLNLEQANHGRRGVSNVMANGGVAMIICIISILFPSYRDIFIFMTICSLATACSDTFSSELGNVYGVKYFNIVDFKKAKRGVDGAISYQGIYFGLIGSIIVAAGSYLIYGDLYSLMMITAIGLSGNIIDSILGATLQRMGYLNNHQVNFLATLSGALIALGTQII